MSKQPIIRLRGTFSGSGAKDKLRQREFASTLVALLIAGCAAQSTAGRQPADINDPAETRMIVADALKAVQSTFHTLEALSELKGPCPPELLTQFSADIKRLQVDSFKLRSHVRAMQSRGDAYFEEWQEHLSGANDPDMRRLAEERRQSLQQSFVRIQRASQPARKSLDAFLSDIRTLRRALEKAPATNIISGLTKELIRNAMEDGQQARQNLGGMVRELDTVTSTLMPEKEKSPGNRGMKTATLGWILFALLTDAGALRAQLPMPFPLPPPIRPPTTPAAQRNALSVLRSQVDWFRNSMRTAPSYATGGYDEVRRQFDLLRAAYDQFKATLTPNQLDSGANELAELGAGLDILQETFDEYQQDVAAGRSQAAAFRSLCRVLDEAAGLWLQELNKVAEKLRVGFQ